MAQSKPAENAARGRMNADGEPATQDERDVLLARYRSMAEEGSDIIVLHENARIVFATGALYRLLGRTPEEFQNGRYLGLVHPDDLAEAATLRGTPPAGKTLTATYRVRHAEGHYLWFEVRTRGVYDCEGVFLREVSVGRDVTERKEHELRLRAAQERAETANRAKSTFLANMSHELRTPLNAILGFSDMMRAELLGPLGHERYREYADSIRQSGMLLLSLIGNILDMSQIDTGRLRLTIETVDLAALVGECLRQTGAPEGLHVRSTILARSATADAPAFKQILLNLLSNAVKFTPLCGSIAVETGYAEDGAIVLQVSDTGTGIAPRDLVRLGQPFEQACGEATLAKAAPGTGLGLALVRALAQAHGGSMQIESELGVGTSVVVRLPQTPMAAAKSS